MPVITVAPVVVSPDMDSKTASVIDKFGSWERNSGSAPNSPSTVQNSTTTTNPSRSRSSRRKDRTGNHSTRPVNSVTAKASRNGVVAPSS